MTLPVRFRSELRLRPQWLAAVCAVLAIVAPFLVPNRFYLLLLQHAGIVVLVTQGLNLLSGYTGQFSLGHAALYGLGAYTSAILAVRWQWPFWATLTASAVCGALAGLILGIPSLRLRGHYLAMMTVVFGIVVEKIIAESQFLGGVTGITGIPPIAFGATPLSPVQAYFVILLLAVLATLLVYMVARSQYGLDLVALRETELAAETLGVPTYRYKLTVFVTSAVLASLGGSLYAHTARYVSPDTFDLMLSIFFLVSIILGGLGTVGGPILGVVALEVLDLALRNLEDYRLIAHGMILIFSVIVLPGGVVRLVSRRENRWSQVQRVENEGRMHRHHWTPGVGTLLQVRNVSKVFGGVPALEGVDLDVRVGSIHALIGPNGSGKTTLVNVVSGVYRPTQGTVYFQGTEIQRLQVHRLCQLGIARTFQRSQVFSQLTCLENVMVALRFDRPGLLPALLRWPEAVRRETAIAREAMEFLHLVGLANKAHVPAHALPYGQQRLLEIARALATRCRLLLLDEPAAGLNPTEVAALGQLIRHIRDMGVTILLVEHNMSLVMNTADWVTILAQGRVLASGKPEEVMRHPEVIRAYLGTKGVVQGAEG